MSVGATIAVDDARRSPSPFASIQRLLNYDLFGIRGLTLQRFGWTAVVVTIFAVVSTIGNAFAVEGPLPSLATVAGYATNFLPFYAYRFVPAMIAVTLADNLPLQGAWRVIALTLALLLSALIISLSSECVDRCSSLDLTILVFHNFLITSAIAVACFARRREQKVAAALHASELARVDAERARLQSELQTMRARVEPTFLLNALHDVGMLYESDRKGGGRMLDLLIQYLRGALPQMRETHSTLEREIGLLRSYLGILALQSNGKLAVAFRLDETLADARIPPMLLVPLVAGATPGHSSSGTVKIDARLLDGRVRITLTAQDAIATRIRNSPALSEIRTRLKAIYGDRATFAVERNDRASRLILEIPFERASSCKADRVVALDARDR